MLARRDKKSFWRIGEPGVWLAATTLAFVLLMIAVFGWIIGSNAARRFWLMDLALLTTEHDEKLLASFQREERNPDGDIRVQYKVANRELNGNADFRWLEKAQICSEERPAAAAIVERQNDGDFYGFCAGAIIDGGTVEFYSTKEIAAAQRQMRQKWLAEFAPLQKTLSQLSARLQREKMRELRLKYQIENNPANTTLPPQLAATQNVLAQIMELSTKKLAELTERQKLATQDVFIFRTAAAREIKIPVVDIIRIDFPNQVSVVDKLRYAAEKSWMLLSEPPRAANTEGGLLPDIFGTVILVLLMSVSAFPLGVIAGIYLREYAKDGALVRVIRIAVNNLAGIPSIVYGIFGLAFFVYGIGGAVDRLIFPERVAAGITSFGTGGVLWASLTLGLLTLPVVIVATEEALGAVPSEVRQGSLALGATRFQTLWRVLMPMASPGILTGFILAISRAAGEVAPLMLTGVVKSALTLPLDGNFPYLHFERKFMHLGFHIYDVGFQSPNVEAAKPMVYVTALLLLAVVFLLNITAIKLRNYMRKKYTISAL